MTDLWAERRDDAASAAASAAVAVLVVVVATKRGDCLPVRRYIIIIIIIIIIIGRRITTITEDTRETTFLFQRLSKEAKSFPKTAKRKCSFFPQQYGNRENCRCNHNFVCLA